MHHDYWHERWALQQIGFHLAEVNPLLTRFWPTLNAAPGGEVLVPLCGKSVDMLWLRAQGHAVLGVELSPQALDAFVRENALSCQPLQHERFAGHALPGMRLFCGDFFKLTSEDVQHVKAVYDRAALVALPPQMRADYAAHLSAILPQSTPMLLITLEYATDSGPPFSVPQAEVERLYAQASALELLHVEHSAFKGLPLEEKVFRVVL